jgi:hypothetical protein
MMKSDAFHFAYIPFVGAEIWILGSKYIYFTAVGEENGGKETCTKITPFSYLS